MISDGLPISDSDPRKPVQKATSAVMEDELTYSRILVPIDFSECSKKSTSYAARFASRYGATLLLVHVFEARGYGVGGDQVAKPDSELLKSHADAVEGAARRSLANIENQLRDRGINVEAYQSTGCPFHEIVKIAGQLHVDLIIIGSHGRTGLTHLLLGSVAERVVEHAQCSVLVVK